MEQNAKSRGIAVCALLMVLALWTIGVVASELIRHIVQTLPLLLVVALGFGKSPWTKWAALPCFIFWDLIAILIWLYLLGISRILHGHFSPTEIAMTIVFAGAGFMGIYLSLRTRSGLKVATAIAGFVLFAALQFVAMKISLLPAIAHR